MSNLSNITHTHTHTLYSKLSCMNVVSCRPGFLPDPNDGSLYILGGKHKEGLMVNMAVSVSVCQLSLYDPHCSDVYVCRNCHSPSLSWSSQLPAGALMVCSTQVRHRAGVYVCVKNIENYRTYFSIMLQTDVLLTMMNDTLTVSAVS